MFLKLSNSQEHKQELVVLRNKSMVDSESMLPVEVRREQNRMYKITLSGGPKH